MTGKKRRTKKVGVRQDLRYEGMEAFGKRLGKKLREVAPPRDLWGEHRRNRGAKQTTARKRLDTIWAEQDAEREMYGDAADEHFFTGMGDAGDK